MSRKVKVILAVLLFSAVLGVGVTWALYRPVPVIKSPYVVLDVEVMSHGGNSRSYSFKSHDESSYYNSVAFTHAEHLGDDVWEMLDPEAVTALFADAISRRSLAIGGSVFTSDYQWNLEFFLNDDSVYIELGKTFYWYSTAISGNKYYAIENGKEIMAELDRMLAEADKK